MSTIKFAIATNKDFADVTVPKCVDSLLKAGVPGSDIYVFEGGNAYPFDLKKRINGEVPKHYEHYNIHEDVMDYNAFLGVLQWGVAAEYWFMLHDTCWVGEGFYEAVKGLKIDSPVMPLCKVGKSMNLGIYSVKYLEANKFFIDSHTEFANKAELKKYMVATEDALLDSYKESSYLCASGPTVTGPTDLYNNGVPRIVVHYEEIDLYKSKANWEPKDNYELGL